MKLHLTFSAVRYHRICSLPVRKMVVRALIRTLLQENRRFLQWQVNYRLMEEDLVDFRERLVEMTHALVEVVENTKNAVVTDNLYPLCLTACMTSVLRL